MDKTPKQIAKDIYDKVVSDGYGTEYFYSHNFKKMSKQLAEGIATANYQGDKLKEILIEIQAI